MADGIGDDGAPVRLIDEEIVGEVAQVEGIDVGWIESFVDRGDHVLEGVDEQVLGVLVRQHVELRHAGPDHGYASRKFSSFCHISFSISVAQ